MYKKECIISNHLIQKHKQHERVKDLTCQTRGFLIEKHIHLYSNFERETLGSHGICHSNVVPMGHSKYATIKGVLLNLVIEFLNYMLKFMLRL